MRTQRQAQVYHPSAMFDKQSEVHLTIFVIRFVTQCVVLFPTSRKRYQPADTH
jgi:hypothetical protein